MKLIVIAGATISASPRLVLPSGTIKLLALDSNGLPASPNLIEAHVLEGGGSFPDNNPRSNGRRSRTTLTHISGLISLPEFRLGPHTGPNRILVQTETGQVEIVVMGSFTNVVLECVNPVGGMAGATCRSTVDYTLRVTDYIYPGAAIPDTPIELYFASGGGWILGPRANFQRAVLLTTDTSGRLYVTLQVSSREETSILVASLSGSPVAELSIYANARRPRLLSAETPGRNEDQGRSATGWLAALARLDTQDTPADRRLWTINYLHDIEVLAEATSGSAQLYPQPLTAGAPIESSGGIARGWTDANSIFIRPKAPGSFGYKFWLPDYPDDEVRTIAGTAEDRFPGQVPFTSVPDPSHNTFIETSLGGVFDAIHGVEISLRSGDVQIVGPNAVSSEPFTFALIPHPPTNPDDRLREIHVRCKVRMTADSSIIDDPGSGRPDNVPGTINTAPQAGGADEQLIVITVGATGSNVVKLWFCSNDFNYDHFVEVTAKALIQRPDGAGGFVTVLENTSILGRAAFYRPRMSITRKAGADFTAVKDEALVPVRIVDSSGAAVPIPDKREFYVEFRCHDLGASVAADISASNTGRKTITLDRASLPPGATGYTLYRSKPIVAYLEDPSSYGLASFTLPPAREYLHATLPFSVQASTTLTVQQNPRRNKFATPARPLAFANLTSADRDTLQTSLPRPKIEFPDMTALDGAYPVVMAGAQLAVTILGVVRDVLGDLAQGAAAQIAEVEINGTAFPLQAVVETATALRPYAWRGEFKADVPLKPGLNIVSVTARNILDETAVRLLHIDLVDPRNDFENPDLAVMRALLRIMPEPETADMQPLLLCHYYMPHFTGTGTVPGQIDLTLESIDKAPAATADDSQTLRLERISGRENIYAAKPVLLLPFDTPAALVTAVRNANVPALIHRPGTRLRLSGSAVPHPDGPIDIQAITSSEQLEYRLMVLDAAANSFIEADQLRHTDTFRIEVRLSAAGFSYPTQIFIAACDRMCGVLDGEDRLLLPDWGPPGPTGWSALTSYMAPFPPPGQFWTADRILAATRSEKGQTGATYGQLRVQGGAGLFAGPDLLLARGRFWPVIQDPERRQLAGATVPQESPRETTAKAGFRETVIAKTGELVLHEQDAELNGRGLNLRLARCYRSHLDYDGPMGHGWGHSLHGWIRRQDDDHYLAFFGDGLIHQFTRSASPTVVGEFDPPPGIYARLVEISPHECRLEEPGGSELIFAALGTNLRDWRPLIDIRDRNRNRLRNSYNQAALPIFAEDPLGQRLLLAHDDAWRLKSAGDLAGRFWTYEYFPAPEGELKSVRCPTITTSHNPFPTGKLRSFTYEAATPPGIKNRRLATLQDGRGNAGPALPGGPSPYLTLSWNDDGQVKAQSIALGPITSTYKFDYTDTVVTVTDSLSRQLLYGFPAGTADVSTTLAETYSEVDGTATFVTSYKYNSQTEMARIEGPMKSAVEILFNDQTVDPRWRGQMLTVTRLPTPGRPTAILNTAALSDFDQDPTPANPASLEWSYSYEPRFQQLRTVTDPLSQVTTLRYDYEDPQNPRSDGNLVEIEAPAVTVGAFQSATGQNARITSWLYDNFGQPVRLIDPNGVVTTFEYYPQSNLSGMPGAAVTTAADQCSAYLARTTWDAAPADPDRSGTLDPTPDPQVTEYGYDRFGEFAIERLKLAGAWKTTLFEHNELGQIVKQTGPTGLLETFYYDDNDDIVKITELIADVGFPAGAIGTSSTIVAHEYAYDRAGKPLKAIIDSGGLNLTHSWEYDAAEQQKYYRTPVANRAALPDSLRMVEYVYDGRGRLSETIHASAQTPQRKVTFALDDEGRMIAKTDANGLFLAFHYDAWGGLISVVDPLRNTRGCLRDALGRPVEAFIEGPHPVSGLVQRLTDRLVYLDESGSVTACVDKVFRWDDTGARQDIGRRVVKYQHDPVCNPVVETGPRNGFETKRVFTGRGEVSSSANVHLGDRNYTWDKAGFMLSETFPGPALQSVPNFTLTLTRQYDAEGRLTYEDQLGGGVTRYWYDTRGQLRLTEDPLGNWGYDDYDAAGRHINADKELRAYGRRRNAGATADNRIIGRIGVSREWDENNNLLSVTGPTGILAVRRVFDAYDELQSTTYPGAETYSFTYRTNGQLLTVTTPDGLLVTNNYDRAGRLGGRSVTMAAGFVGLPTGTTLQHFGYDAANRCISASDSSTQGQCGTDLGYDSLGNVWKDAQSQTYVATPQPTRTVNAVFKATGDMQSLTYSTNATAVPYDFDPVGRMRQAGEAFYKYDNQYLLRRKYAPNTDLTLTVVHGRDGRIQQYIHEEIDPLGAQIQLYHGEQFVWNEAGFPTLVANQRNQTVRSITYDSVNRTTEVYDGIPAASLPSVIPQVSNSGVWLEHDKRGNVLNYRAGRIDSVTPSGTDLKLRVKLDRWASRRPNDNNQIVESQEFVDPSSPSLWNAQRQYHWKLSGGTVNLLRRDSFSYDKRGNLSEDRDFTYEYDAFNRLSKATAKATGVVTHYRYDGFGRRILKDETRFVYSQRKLIEEISQAANTIRRFIHAAEGPIALELVRGATTSRYFMHEDRAGGTLFLSERPGGQIAEVYGYDAFGAPIAQDAQGTNLDLKTILNHILHHGQYYDAETNLYHVGARYYHPSLQRMLQRDPVQWDDDTNAYSYAGSNLFGFTDPSGNVKEKLKAQAVKKGLEIAEESFGRKAAERMAPAIRTAFASGGFAAFLEVAIVTLGIAAAAAIVVYTIHRILNPPHWILGNTSISPWRPDQVRQMGRELMRQTPWLKGTIENNVEYSWHITAGLGYYVGKFDRPQLFVVSNARLSRSMQGTIRRRLGAKVASPVMRTHDMIRLLDPSRSIAQIDAINEFMGFWAHAEEILALELVKLFGVTRRVCGYCQGAALALQNMTSLTELTPLGPVGIQKFALGFGEPLPPWEVLRHYVPRLNRELKRIVQTPSLWLPGDP